MPKWKQFEELVAQVQSDLAPEAHVTHNDRILGRLTGTKRQVDISIRQTVGQFPVLIIIDCKDLASPVDVKGVEEVIGLANDVGANKAAIVAAEGFTATAKTRAEKAGLDLYRLVDCRDHNWKSYVTVPAAVDWSSIKTFRIMLRMHDGEPVPKFEEVPVLYNANGIAVGTLTDIVLERWNQGEFATEPGTYENVAVLQDSVYVKIDNDLCQIDLRARIVVGRESYLGDLPLDSISGFRNEITGGVVSRGFSTAPLDMEMVKQQWRRIDSVADLAVQPVLGFGMSQYYPLGQFNSDGILNIP